MDAEPGGWQASDLSETELKFGEHGRDSLRGWSASGAASQCTVPQTPLPGSEMYNLLSAEHNRVEETCCVSPLRNLRLLAICGPI